MTSKSSRTRSGARKILTPEEREYYCYTPPVPVFNLNISPLSGSSVGSYNETPQIRMAIESKEQSKENKDNKEKDFLIVTHSETSTPRRCLIGVRNRANTLAKLSNVDNTVKRSSIGRIESCSEEQTTTVQRRSWKMCKPSYK